MGVFYLSYLSLEEYKEIIGDDTELEAKEFNKLLRKASDLLDIQTRHFYQHNDLEKDNMMLRKAFKKSVAYQIEYMHEADATTSYGIQEPASWSIGRMSVNTGNTSDKSDKQTIVSLDALTALSGTGLLYRGVRL